MGGLKKSGMEFDTAEKFGEKAGLFWYNAVQRYETTFY